MLLMIVLFVSVVLCGIVTEVYSAKVLHFLQEEGVEISRLADWFNPWVTDNKYHAFIARFDDEEKRRAYSRTFRRFHTWRMVTFALAAMWFAIIAVNIIL